MSFRIIAAFVIFIFGMRVNGQTVTPSEPLSKTLTIFDLPPFERAVCCIRFYEGLHRKKDYPYVGYGHRLRPGERYSSEMTASEAEALLRKDLKELCSLFRPYGKDSLRVCQNACPLFFMTKPRLSQAEALLCPKDFVSLSIIKTNMAKIHFRSYNPNQIVLTIPTKSSFFLSG